MSLGRDFLGKVCEYVIPWNQITPNSLQLADCCNAIIPTVSDVSGDVCGCVPNYKNPALRTQDTEIGMQPIIN